MPKIKNVHYLAFKGIGENFETMKLNEFLIHLNKINYTNQFKTKQARCLAILLFATSRRPVELLQLKPRDIIKEKTGYLFLFKTAKRGDRNRVLFPRSDLLKEVWEFSERVPEGVFLFSAFRPPPGKVTVNKVRYFSRKQDKWIHKSYDRITRNIDYFAKKWFEWPAYLFRHNRITRMYELGATDKNALFVKGGKDARSLTYYLGYSKRMQEKTKRYLKMD